MTRSGSSGELRFSRMSSWCSAIRRSALRTWAFRVSSRFRLLETCSQTKPSTHTTPVTPSASTRRFSRGAMFSQRSLSCSKAIVVLRSDALGSDRQGEFLLIRGSRRHPAALDVLEAFHTLEALLDLVDRGRRVGGRLHGDFVLL